MTPPDTRSNSRAIDWDALPYGGDLFGEIYLAGRTPPAQPPRAWLRHLPGLAVVAVAAGTAAWLAEHYGFPIILLGLLIGLALNFISREETIHAGLDLAARGCLRWGIVLLGLQVTLAQVVALGPWPFAALLAIMAVTSPRVSAARRYRVSRATPGYSPAGRPRSAGRARRWRSMASSAATG